MKHLQEMMQAHDGRTAALLACQVTDKDNPVYGSFVRWAYNMDTRSTGFALAHLLISYLAPQSRYHLDEQVKEAICGALTYLETHQRPDGCLDLNGCNFNSPPDTAFTMNAVLNGWWLLEKYNEPEAAWLCTPLRRLLEKCAEGIAAGGFHTPNHRWAICANLKHVAQITGREEFIRRADQYLNEGLDINEDGEFSERSAGNYNQVNDDQMIRLFMSTGDVRFLEAAEANLRMMLAYIEPDDSVFTNNSTRQDNGRKVYLDTYYILFLLVGYFLKKKDLAAYAEYCYSTAMRHGRQPVGVEWLLLYDDLDGYGDDVAPDLSCVTHYEQHFRDSRLVRTRSGNVSCTLMDGKPNCLYFQHGAAVMYMVIYENLCDQRNFRSDKVEKIDGGYRMTCRQSSWYYLPFEEKPATSDWWAMDNPHTRKRLNTTIMDTTVDVIFTDDGVDVTIHTDGLDQLPLRVEFGFAAGSQLRHQGFLMEGKAGQSLLLADGALEVIAPCGDVITLSGGFAEHANLHRYGDAYQQSPDHFTVYMTAFTPVEKTIHIGTKRLFGKTLF